MIGRSSTGYSRYAAILYDLGIREEGENAILFCQANPFGVCGHNRMSHIINERLYRSMILVGSRRLALLNRAGSIFKIFSSRHFVPEFPEVGHP